MITTSHQCKPNRVNSVYVLLLLSGTYLTLMLPGILKLPFFLFTLPLKYSLLLYSLYLVTVGCLRGSRTFSPPSVLLPFLVFWFVYVIRLFLDLFVFDVRHVVFDRSFDYFEEVAFILIPCLGLCFARGVDYEWVLRWSFIFYFIASCLSFFISLNLSPEDVQRDVGRFEGTQGMNSIGYGHNGTTLSLMATILFFSYKDRFLLRLLYVVAFCAGLFTIYLAGSRGPLVALIVCLLLYSMINKGVFRGLMIITAITLPFIFFFEQIIEIMGQFGSVFIDRVLLALYEGQTAGRDSIYRDALNDFFGSPIWGSGFVLSTGRSGGTYPHNLLLESLMATGIMGGMFFFIWFFKAVRVSLVFLKTRPLYAWIGLIFLQQVIYGMFSLAIYTHSKFWHLSIIAICIYYSRGYKISGRSDALNPTIHSKAAHTHC